MMEEIWKDIKGFEGRYQVSNLGRVRSLDMTYMSSNQYSSTEEFNVTKKGRILKPVMNVWGYYRVNLANHGKTKIRPIHRLVAETFLPNPNNYKCVNHKDENKLNNTVFFKHDGSIDVVRSNLEWCTFKYNDNYGTRNKRITEKVNRQRMKPVMQLDLNNNIINTFESICQASAYTGLSRRAIWSVCNNKRKSHRGFIFKYK